MTALRTPKTAAIALLGMAVSFLTVLALSAPASSAQAKPHRSHAAKIEFQESHPCPATGRTMGKCRGYVIDHIRPLACGGADAPHNMQWQTKAEARAKDRHERRHCRRWAF